MKSLFIATLIFSFLAPFANAEHSVARLWNDAALSGIRKDYARPTIAARTLYHLSIAAYDGWAMYDPGVRNFYYNQKHVAADVERARVETITVASYRIMMHRFQGAPRFSKIAEEAEKLAAKLNVDVTNFEATEGPIGVGNQLAEMILALGNSDGSLEDQNYETPPMEYPAINGPMIIKQSGVGTLKNVNYWQPLALDQIIDQGGNPLPSQIQQPLTLHWGRVQTFALDSADKNPKNELYLDPGAPPMWGGVGHQDFVSSMVDVIRYSSWLDPKDEMFVDISPGKIGNNSLGRNDGQGHKLNPSTNAPYAEQMVPRGDFARVLAEFWADGPNSETPPGHWNVVANHACDHPEFKKRWFGQTDVATNLEWDVKMYLTLNGAMHDTAVAVWGIKGYYQGSRPLTAIRYLSSLGQSNHPELPSYNVLGLPLIEGLIELITEASTAPGQKHAHLVGHEGKITLRSWKGAPSPGKPNKGVAWILGEDWIPYQKATFVTPPFPGYVSGHSAYSRAAAEVLAAITGSKFFPGGMAEYKIKAHSGLVFESGPSQDISLQWGTYFDAADQSATSRIYGGIHGSIDDFPSRRIGSKVGRKALARAQKLFN